MEYANVDSAESVMVVFRSWAVVYIVGAFVSVGVIDSGICIISYTFLDKDL